MAICRRGAGKKKKEKKKKEEEEELGLGAEVVDRFKGNSLLPFTLQVLVIIIVCPLTGLHRDGFLLCYDLLSK